MAIPLNDNIRVKGGKPLDDKRMNNGVPYVSVEEVNSKILIGDRSLSLEVFVVDRIYWYHEGINDADLVIQNIGGEQIEDYDYKKLVDDTILF